MTIVSTGTCKKSVDEHALGVTSCRRSTSPWIFVSAEMADDQVPAIPAFPLLQQVVGPPTPPVAPDDQPPALANAAPPNQLLYRTWSSTSRGNVETNVLVSSCVILVFHVFV